MERVQGAYWSVERCGWVASPATPDALATPWSAYRLELPQLVHPHDADDVLRSRRPGHVPGQRPDEQPAEAPSVPATG